MSETSSPSTIDNQRNLVKDPSSLVNTTNKAETNDNLKEKNNDSKKLGRLTWTDQTEELLVGWADVSACYKWLHEASFRKYNKKNYYFAVPIIVLSTVAGTLSVSISGYVPETLVSYAQAGIGAINIFTGVLTTLQSLFKYAQLSESHSNVSIGWSKLQRNISIALSVDRDSRSDADSFIKICRSEYDRLIEQSPSIPEDVIEDFKIVYQRQQQRKLEEKKKKQKAIENGTIHIDEDLILPDICDAIHHTKVFKTVIELVENKTNINSISTEYNSSSNNKKDDFKEKISKLEKKIGGVNQYKTIMMSERLAPLIQENNVLSHNKDIEIIKVPFRNDASHLNNISLGRRGSISKDNYGPYKENYSQKSDIFNNKENFVLHKPPFNHLQSIIGHPYNQKRYSFVEKNINEDKVYKKEEAEVPKGKVKNLINRYRATISNSTEGQEIKFLYNNKDIGSDKDSLETDTEHSEESKIEKPDNESVELKEIKIDSCSQSSESHRDFVAPHLAEMKAGKQSFPLNTISTILTNELYDINTDLPGMCDLNNSLNNTPIQELSISKRFQTEDSDLEISVVKNNLEKTPVATPTIISIS